MAVIGRTDVLNATRGMHFSLRHFARGTYPVRGVATLSVNRLLLFESGSKASHVDCGGRRIVPAPGVVCLIPAGTPADVTLDDQTRFVSAQFRLDVFFGEDLVGRSRAMRTLRSPKLVREAVSIYEEKNALFPGVRLQEMLIRILTAMGVPLEVPENSARGPEFSETLAAVAGRCDARLAVAELAELENMPRGSFSRAFSRKFGVSPKCYLQRALMLRAESLLLQPGMNVRRTAEKLRFSNEFYFSRFFRKHSEMSPDEYRRQFS